MVAPVIGGRQKTPLQYTYVRIPLPTPTACRRACPVVSSPTPVPPQLSFAGKASATPFGTRHDDPNPGGKTECSAATLGEPAGQQTVGSECSRLLRIWPVEVENVGRLPWTDRSTRARGLHADAISYCEMRGGDLGSPGSSKRHLIQLFRAHPDNRAGSAQRSRPVSTSTARVADRTKLHALVARWQKAAAPQAVVQRLGRYARPARSSLRTRRSCVSAPKP